MAKCKFKGTDPLHFKTYDCTAAAKTDDGYCQRHEFSLNRTLDLIKRVGELEARLKQTQQWRDYYRRMWHGESVTEVEIPITDAELTNLLDKRGGAK